jgi:cell wall-associated NlpC family hydrolase
MEGCLLSSFGYHFKTVRASLCSLILGAGLLLFPANAWGEKPAASPSASPAAVTAPAPAASPAAVESPAEVASPSPEATPLHRRPSLSSRHGVMLRRITTMAHKMEGVPYVFGGTSAYGVDCSGFTQRIFALAGIKLPRMADEQYHKGKPVANPAPGDLVFFSTYLPGPSHVGIYLGNGYFIHAASHSGVTVSSLSESYYRSRYIGARRYF